MIRSNETTEQRRKRIDTQHQKMRKDYAFGPGLFYVSGCGPKHMPVPVSA